MTDYDRCVDTDARPVLSDRTLRVFIGLDGSYQHDSTAVATVAFDPKQQKVQLVTHKIFTPRAGAPVDFAAVEAELLRLRRDFAVQTIFFDPYQLVALSQRMVALGLPMESFSQTSSNLEAAATNLGELIRHSNLSMYADPEIRLAMSRTVAVETPRGVRISKTKASHRIDIVAALSFAAFAAVRGGQVASGVDLDFQQRAQAVFREQSRLRTEHADAAPDSHASRGGFEWARREDAEEARLRSSPRWRLRGF
jgi:phage terminase large subunit-like protein